MSLLGQPRRLLRRSAAPPLSRVGDYTFRFHAPSLALEGVVQGAFSLNDIILKKTLHASDATLTGYVTGQSMALLFPALWTDINRGRYVRSHYLWFGGAGRLLLIALAFVTAPLPFAGIVVASMILAYALIPSQNMLYQSNYRPGERGHAFGFARRIFAIGFVVAALAAGALNQVHPYAWRGYYVVVALAGFLSFWLFWRVRLRRTRKGAAADAPAAPPEAGDDWLWMRLGGSVRLLLGERDFLIYESFFFCYGLAFMMLSAVLPVFLVEGLHVDYAQAGTAKGLVMYGVFIIVSPLAGRLCDRWGPVRLAATAFACMGLFPITLCFVHGIGALYGAYAIFGTSLAAVDIAWNLGPIHFARGQDSTRFMGAHTSLVALRALIGGPAGMTILRMSGTPRATFVTAAVCLITGSAGMLWLSRRLARARSD